MENKKLAPINELVSAILADKMSDSEMQSLQADPQSFILAQTNIQVDNNVAFNFVENDSNTVNLSLPYYDALLTTDAHQMSEEDMDNISGGEILGLIIGAIIGSGVALGLTLGVPGTVTAVAIGAGVGTAVGVGTTVGAVVGSQRHGDGK